MCMIEVHPNIGGKYFCPVCEVPLELKGFVINGMRNLVEGHCSNCSKDFYVDMPVGHGLFYPFAIEKNTLQLYGGPINWFGKLLRESLKFLERDKVVLVNCLDFLYGHSLLKLFNVQHYLDQHPDLGCCVLVPKQIRHLVPDGVAEIWEVDLPLREYRHWHVSLEESIRKEIYKKKKVYLSLAYPCLPPSSAPHVFIGTIY